MKVEELQKEMEQIEKTLQKYIQAREKLQEKIIPLESRREKILAELNSDQSLEQHVNGLRNHSVIAVKSPSLQQVVDKLSSPFNSKGAGHNSNLLTALQHTKGILEKFEHNLDNTFRTVNEITSLITTIKGHSSQISRLAKKFSALGLNKKVLGGGSSATELAELTQHPVVRNLAKELLTSLNKA
ncbi:MAG: hypothetical protein WA118_05300 [Carboxydocellales bacterium]